MCSSFLATSGTKGWGTQILKQTWRQAHNIELDVYVEARDSRRGCFIPVRYGLGVWSDGRVLGVNADVIWKLKLTFRPEKKYFWSFQIGFWLMRRISRFWDRVFTQNFEPDLSSRVVWPVEPFWKRSKMKLGGPYLQKWDVSFWEG